MPAEKTVVAASSFPTFANVRDEDAATGFNGVFFGPPGAGKTTLAASIKLARPDEKVLLFDLDVGRESVRDLDIDYVSGLTWVELRAHLDTALVLKDDSPYKTYIFDSLSSIYYELVFPEAERRLGSGKDGRQYYFEAQKILTKFVRDAKTLAEYGINTIFTGHVKEEGEGALMRQRLSLPQGIRNEILLIVNHVGYISRMKNSEVRELYMTPPKMVDGPKLRQVQSGPQAPLHYENPTMGMLLEALAKVKADGH